jgi:TonB family protein
MNFDFYVFQLGTEYKQYVSDSTREIFQNIDIQAKEQLSFYHDERLIYYIYTNNGIGFSIVFNTVICTHYNRLLTLFREFYSRIEPIIKSNISEKDFLFSTIVTMVPSFKEEITDFLSKFTASYTCSKPTYNISSDENTQQAIKYNADILSNPYKLQDLKTAIDKYRWVYIPFQTQIIQPTIPTQSTKSKPSRNIPLWNILLYTFSGILVVLIIIAIYDININESSMVTETTTETPIEITVTETTIETPVEITEKDSDRKKVSEQYTKNIKESTSNDHQAKSEIEIVVDQTAMFPGGYQALNKFLHDNIRYPQRAKETKTQGKVFLTFVVEEDGSLTDIKIVQDIGYGCGKEAVRVVKSMPKWIPAKHKGIAVRQQFNLPVSFTL